MEKRLNCVMSIAEEMLISGAEVHRAEDSVKRMCLAFGAVRTDVFIITSSMVVTVHTQNGDTITQTRRITSTNTDYEKLHRLNQLSRKICEKQLNCEEIDKSLEEIKKAKSYPFWLECVSYAVIAGVFTLFFGGSFVEAAVSLFIGAVVRLGMVASDFAVSNKVFSRFISAVIATFFAYIAVRVGLIASVDKVIIGNIMTLIPGIGLTNALRDLFTGDSIAGLLRSIEAVLIALAIAAGYFLVAVLGGLAL